MNDLNLTRLDWDKGGGLLPAIRAARLPVVSALRQL